jgi:hypothetical protein
VLDWFWKPLDRLPEPPPRHDDPKGEKLYRQHLADAPAEHALARLESLLSAMPLDT